MIICLDIVGINKEEQGHQIRDAIEQTMLTLMPKRRNPIFIDVEIARAGDMGRAVAMVHEEAQDHFFMTLDETLLDDTEELITTVCHETVHIKQYLRKECRDIAVDRKKWKGVEYDLNETNYYDLPWEQEAYFLQMILADKVIKNATENKSTD